MHAAAEAIVRARRVRRALAAGLGLAALALACAAPPRPLVEADSLGGVRALDASYRVKDRFSVRTSAQVEYLLPVGEYRPVLVDDEGVYFAAPSGILERAGFSKRSVAGGLFAASGSEAAIARPMLYVERPNGNLAKLPLPAAVLGAWGDGLSFAVKGREVVPSR
jgi:hypothetical protein